MSFQAKRLRVQLPCGEGTVYEEEAARAQDCIGLTCGAFSQCGPGTGCAFPTDVCEGGTCWFQTPINCGFSPCGGFASFCEFHSGCPAFASPCGGFASPCGFPSPCRFGTCGFPSPCRFGTCGFLSPCGPRTAIACQRGSDLPIDPGIIVVDPEDLPALRQALEAQLKEIEKAEQALKERGESDK
jgi:hypothetical protein